MQNLSGQQIHIRLVFENTQLYHDIRHYMAGRAEISKIGRQLTCMEWRGHNYDKLIPKNSVTEIN